MSIPVLEIRIAAAAVNFIINKKVILISEVPRRVSTLVSVLFCEQCDQIWQFFLFLGKHSKPVATIILPKSTKIVRQF